MITIYSKTPCPYCVRAKALLTSLKVEFKEIDITGDLETFQKIYAMSGMMTVPQIYINNTCIGGYTDVAALHEQGKLASILKGEIPLTGFVKQTPAPASQASANTVQAPATLSFDD